MKTAIRIVSYKDLLTFILIIQSRGGLGKTYNADKILGKSVLKINSHMTPLGLYESAYRNAGKNIWMDDVEDLFNNDKTVGLCKQLCESLPEKEVSYLTSWNIEKSRDLPKKFKTSSKVMMTLNTIQRLKNNSIGALLDRGIIIEFEPADSEIRQYIQSSFKETDEELLTFLSNLKHYGLRDYIKCAQLKSAGFDNWKALYSGKAEKKRAAKRGPTRPGMKTGRPLKSFPSDVEEIILKLHDEGLSSRKIATKIKKKFKISYSFNTIIAFIKRHRDYDSQKSKGSENLPDTKVTPEEAPEAQPAKRTKNKYPDELWDFVRSKILTKSNKKIRTYLQNEGIGR